MNINKRIIITRSLLNSIRTMTTGLTDIADEQTATILKITMRPMYKCVKHLTDGIVDYTECETDMRSKSGTARKR